MYPSVVFTLQCASMRECHLRVTRQTHGMEIGQAVAALDLLDLQLDLAVTLIVVVVQVGQVALEHAALEPVRGELQALGLAHGRLARRAHRELGRRLHIVPLLLRERVDGLLLPALLALRESLILSNRHGGGKPGSLE